ncbi:sigma-70 family RNA polymerase sigma factor [Chitinasiproducens palmae]|uniref:RNA polymerase sigma-70 factor, ECF subfamily n=1 Tax=Chitinasiproducens palmae TaxID=1770053 RepID=A0A1H2PT51_9BURK|nr:sigma-70 family RNA polymerase sigma factor [Chitinasiproducens palmae]SDV50275.1 RNA polymerase sigma-70 factor, ECF subfamily [Chitinasiproducens palmae]
MAMLNQVSSQDVETLYFNHHGWLLGWLRRKLDNSFDAADLAHDTFVRVLRKRELEALREPRAYLCAIARDLAVSHWRRQALEQAWLETLATLPEPIVPSLEQRALILETLEQIALILDALPMRVRQIFLLSQIDGLTYPQIAAQLGVSINVVQKAMVRALMQCYKVLYRGG